MISIFVAEYNRWANEKRRLKLHETPPSTPTGDVEKALLTVENGPPGEVARCMAAIVGYREDPDLFYRALESYKATEGLDFTMVGVDGDQAADMDMVRIFQMVYPKNSAVIHLDEPLGEIAMRTYSKLVDPEMSSPEDIEYCNELTISHCCQLAREILREHDIQFDKTQPGGGITKLCIYEPHMHKKAIMFTSFIFSIVISEVLDIEFMWSSDSDTIVLPDSLQKTIATVAGDENAGGASSGLIVHNEHETLWTKLGSAVYWCELYLTRSTSASSGTSDCQSGPSTVFRISALPGILYCWYTQKVMGKRMIVNEDRHLTTNLLLRGWTVTYVSDTLTATDTPTTLSRWLLQQVRWGRATHIETFQQPKVYLLNHPVFFWAAMKREVGPLIVFFSILYYLITGHPFVYFCWWDLVFRAGYTIIYNWLRNPDRGPTNGFVWIIPALLFYNLPLPAIQIWSMATVLEGGWGTTMRSNGEMSKQSQSQLWKRWHDLGFFVLWMGVIGGTCARIAGGLLSWSDSVIFKALWVGMLVPSAITFYALIVS